eukprot:14716853-Heterocapsa_arctica.AAC.1
MLGTPPVPPSGYADMAESPPTLEAVSTGPPGKAASSTGGPDTTTTQQAAQASFWASHAARTAAPLLDVNGMPRPSIFSSGYDTWKAAPTAKSLPPSTPSTSPFGSPGMAMPGPGAFTAPVPQPPPAKAKSPFGAFDPASHVRV